MQAEAKQALPNASKAVIRSVRNITAISHQPSASSMHRMGEVSQRSGGRAGRQPGTSHWHQPPGTPAARSRPESVRKQHCSLSAGMLCWMAALASVEPVCCIDVTSHGGAAAGLCAATSASAAEPLPLTAPRIYLEGSGATAAYGTCSFVCSWCLLVFYDKRFPARRLRLRCTDLSRLFLWALVVANISTCERPSLCAFGCAVVQVPPVRAVFQATTGRWPSWLAPVMPAPGIAASMRQMMGPPYIIFVVSASTRHWCGMVARAENFACTMSIIAATTAICAGCFVRPDNDWTGLCWFGRANTHARRAAHGGLMSMSFGCNLHGALVEGITVSSAL
jgi:hypothetical protein